jgi:hypothetical protein
MSAASALIDMATEGGGATACDGPQDLQMNPAEPVTVALHEVPAGNHALAGCRPDTVKTPRVPRRSCGQSELQYGLMRWSAAE